MMDAEVICEFMGGAKPSVPEHFSGVDELPLDSGWWIATTTGYLDGDDPIVLPRTLTLDALHEVEARLTQPQKQYYMSHLASLNGLVGKFYEDAWVYLHATAEQKIATLARVVPGGNEA